MGVSSKFHFILYGHGSVENNAMKLPTDAHQSTRLEQVRIRAAVAGGKQVQ